MVHWVTGMPIKIPWPPGLQSAIWALGLPCPGAPAGSPCLARPPGEVTATSFEGRWGGVQLREGWWWGKVAMRPIPRTKK